MFRRMLPMGLLLVFAIYGYAQNNSTTAIAKETKATQTAANCSKFVDKNGDGICDVHKNCTQCKGKENCGKSMQDCKASCSGSHGKGCCGTTGSGCGKGNGNGNGNGCQYRHGSGNQTDATDKTKAPTK